MANDRKLETECYLVFSKSGNRGWPKLSVRLAIKKPPLKAGEIPMQIKLVVPERLFDTPQFSATLEIPDTIPQDVRLGIPDQIARLVQENLGITLNILKPDSEE